MSSHRRVKNSIATTMWLGVRETERKAEENLIV